MDYSVQKKRNFIALLAAYFAANVIFIMSPAINAMGRQDTGALQEERIQIPVRAASCKSYGSNF